MRVAALAGLMSLMVMGNAAAQEISSSMSASDIAQLLDNAGFGGEILEDRDTGAPVGIGQMGDISFVVRAMECSGSPVACERLLFFANFGLGREVTDADFRIVNDFNDSSFDGRAYVLDSKNEIGIDYYIDLTGGVTTDHIESRISRWQGVVESFLDELRSANTGS